MAAFLEVFLKSKVRETGEAIRISHDAGTLAPQGAHDRMIVHRFLVLPLFDLIRRAAITASIESQQ